MPKKEQEKKPEIEKEYVIPLREKCRVVPRYKKTNKAVKTIKEFLVRHMKIRDRDLRKIKIDTSVNEYLWDRGIRNPPHKIKVKVKKDGENVRVELVDMPKKLIAKKVREEKREKKASETKKKKPVVAKTQEKAESKEGKEEKIEEEKEKKASVVEKGKEMGKAEAKKMKHASKKPAQSMVAQKQNLAR